MQHRPPQRYQPRQRRGEQSPRNLLFAIGVFVLALIFVGAVIVTGRDDSDDKMATVATATVPIVTQATATASQSGSTATSDPLAVAPTATIPATVAVEDTPEEELEPTPTPTVEAPEPTPTEEAPAPPTATTEPLIGDFGQLPPAQIVSGGTGRPLNLTYTLDRGAVSAPNSADVYQLIWPQWTADSVTSIASGLGISGTATKTGANSFEVVGDGGALHVSSRVIQYSNAAAAGTGTLEDDDTLIANAQDWLASSGLVPGNVGTGSIIGTDTAAGVAVVFIKPASPSPLLAAFPSASITITAGGHVREANIQWPVDYAASTYGMKSLDEVWNRVLAGQGAAEADLSQVPGSGAVRAELTVDSVGIAYSVASGGSGDYLVPLMVFSGSAVSSDGTSFPVSIYISAVQGESSAAG